MATPKAENPIPPQMPDDVEKYENFFSMFEEVPDQRKYRLLIQSLQGLDELVFLYEDLAVYDPALATRLREHPSKGLEDATEALRNIMRIDRGGELTPLEEEKIKCRVFTRDNSLFVPIRELEVLHLSKLNFIRGTVTGVSGVKPEINILTVQCNDCGHDFQFPQWGLTMRYPEKCTNPGCKSKTFVTIEEKTAGPNWQSVTVVESIDDIPDGRIPENKIAIMRENLVKRCLPGDQFSMMAIYHKYQSRGKSRVWDTDLECIMLEATSQQPVSVSITDEELQVILQLAKDPNIRKRLLKSFAPSIVGRDDAKMACLLLSVGGVADKTEDETHIRGDLHVLLVGDPGVGKTKLMESLQKTCPRVIICTGGGVTKAGLTVAVIKDDKGNLSLQLGVIPLAHLGIACIDEMDKMEEEDRSNIYSAMETQLISIHKGGFNTDVNSQTSVLAAANPKDGRWDPSKTSVENLRKLPPFLLSRFDLIIVVIDQPDHERDSLISAAILRLNKKPIPSCEEETKVETKPEEDKIPIEILRKYLYYAKHNFKPQFTNEASLYLQKFYLSMRDQYEATKAVSLSPRNLGGLIRICQAWAKLGLQNEVALDDVKQVISEIYLPFLVTVGYDASKCIFDMDLLTSGKTPSPSITSEIDRAKKYCLKLLSDLIHQNNQPVLVDLFEEMLDPAKIENLEPSYVVQKLINEKMVDLVTIDGEKYLKILGRK